MDIKQHVVDKNATIRYSMELLNTAKKTIFVVDQSCLMGSLTDGDIRRWILSGGSLDECVVKAMNSQPRKVMEADIQKAQQLINEYDLFAIPVVDSRNHIVDIIFWNENRHHKKIEKLNLPVVIMAGGKGERLLPYTSIVPKPLIPIGEKPISELVIESFKQYGCKEYYFTLNYKKNMIKAYFDDIYKDYTIKFIEENEPLGTGGSLYFIKEYIGKTFFVSNCDILLDVDYSSVYRFHVKSKNTITIITSVKKYSVPYGIVNIDENGKIQSMTEKPSSDYLVNTGVYVVEPEALEYLGNKEFIHMTELIEKCMADGRDVGTYPISEEAWMDMGQFEDLERMKTKIR